MQSPPIEIDTRYPALVTGATGYIAGWLVKQLLAAGVTVHATVRDPDNIEKVGHLIDLGDSSPGTLRLFQADLLQEGSYDDAMSDCQVVFHTASPFTLTHSDAQRDLIDPALEGTRNVLASVNRCPTVTRVVVTSSVAAIYHDNHDCDKAPGGVLTEAQWNTGSTLDNLPYALSKTLAEKAAWALADAQDRWSLATINPALVVGPGLAPGQTSGSFEFLTLLTDGSFRDGAPHLDLGAVDVRDVADAHCRAGYLKTAKGRYINYATTLTLYDIAEALHPLFPSLPLPEYRAHEGPRWRADNRRSIDDLGVNYRDPVPAIVDMVQQMIDNGDIKVPASK
ncbi:NAD-dependent epimerase/dehydratase family protein [Luminiphilus syltensis]|nr:NAD-dependent epimerase/dehydratase family protein [Luminiphilus syltensis]